MAGDCKAQCLLAAPSHVLLCFVCSMSHDFVAGLGHCRKERIHGGIYGSRPFSIAWASRNCFGAAFWLQNQWAKLRDHPIQMGNSSESSHVAKSMLQMARIVRIAPGLLPARIWSCWSPWLATPFCMNALQFWVTDNFIKKKGRNQLDITFLLLLRVPEFACLIDGIMPLQTPGGMIEEDGWWRVLGCGIWS